MASFQQVIIKAIKCRSAKLKLYQATNNIGHDLKFSSLSVFNLKKIYSYKFSEWEMEDNFSSSLPVFLRASQMVHLSRRPQQLVSGSH
ncbi:hypothetical protein AV530_017712 [Patagioenas fasciata monilis]|uniref:Uncharacterized protein n=1 Tax=Patagioenas fasciata monilis TaxID=372326 RepID=A0A1V4KVN3_PATFA|nr:hypothetical protein AV530_017712 [Patagioenas fasciata monilis]